MFGRLACLHPRVKPTRLAQLVPVSVESWYYLRMETFQSLKRRFKLNSHKPSDLICLI